MKVLCQVALIVLWMLSNALPSGAQYAWTITQNFKDDTVSNYTPLMLDCSGSHCTAVMEAGGARYFLMRSDDGGLSWHTQKSIADPGGVYPGFRYFYTMQQIDSGNAVIVGDSGHILRTTDAGTTWSFQKPPEDYRNASLWGVHFHDGLNGIIGAPDRALTTSDGGITWSPSPRIGTVGDENCHCYGAGMFAVFCEGNTRLYRTHDNWLTIDSTDPISDTGIHHPALRRSNWSENDTIILFGSSYNNGEVEPLIVTSYDAGSHWQRAAIPQQIHSQNPSVLSMSHLSDDTLYAGGSFPGTIMKSVDRGATWKFDTVVIAGEEFAIQTETSIARPAPGIVLASMVYTPQLYSPGIIARADVRGLDKVSEYRESASVNPYPNPATSLTSFNLSERKPSKIQVMDMLGRNILQIPLQESSPITIDVSHLAPGNYFIQNGQERAKFVKE